LPLEFRQKSAALARGGRDGVMVARETRGACGCAGERHLVFLAREGGIKPAAAEAPPCPHPRTTHGPDPTARRQATPRRRPRERRTPPSCEGAGDRSKTSGRNTRRNRALRRL